MRQGERERWALMVSNNKTNELDESVCGWKNDEYVTVHTADLVQELFKYNKEWGSLLTAEADER